MSTTQNGSKEEAFLRANLPITGFTPGCQHGITTRPLATAVET